MVFGWVTLAVLYLFLLFSLASWGEKNSPTARALTSHPAIYSLALAIYCTAWTFFGMVGQASRDTWIYLPIMLGPILVYVLGYMKYDLPATYAHHREKSVEIAVDLWRFVPGDGIASDDDDDDDVEELSRSFAGKAHVRDGRGRGRGGGRGGGRGSRSRR